MARPHIEPYCELDFNYKEMTLPGFPKGMMYKMLSMDTDNGSCTMKVMLTPGYKRKPGLSYSEMEIYVLGGSFTLGDQLCQEGEYIFVPAGMSLPAMTSENGCEVLFYYNTGEPSFVESDTHHPYANIEGYSHVNALEGLSWFSPNVQPGPAPGCLIKMLKYNERTHAMTFMYCMTPNYWQDNISYHDCAEESYHIWGTSWMMQFGDLPTGGYFWRPPYINHGAFASKHGTLALGRVDSEIFNHFHFNPFTTPEENENRAVARMYRQNPMMYKWMLSKGHNHPHGPEDFEFPHAHDDGHHEHGPNFGHTSDGR